MERRSEGGKQRALVRRLANKQTEQKGEERRRVCGQYGQCHDAGMGAMKMQEMELLKKVFIKVELCAAKVYILIPLSSMLFCSTHCTHRATSIGACAT